MKKLIESSLSGKYKLESEKDILTIRIEKDGTIYSGQGSDTDIIFASAKAYVNAINRYLIIKSSN